MSNIEKEVEAIARRVCQEEIGLAKCSLALEATNTEEVQELKNRLHEIQAKEYISVKEAALLLNCSSGHIGNLVNAAKRGESVDPIPFRDLVGRTSLNRQEFLEWSKRNKTPASTRRSRSQGLRKNY